MLNRLFSCITAKVQAPSFGPSAPSHPVVSNRVESTFCVYHCEGPGTFLFSKRPSHPVVSNRVESTFLMYQCESPGTFLCVKHALLCLFGFSSDFLGMRLVMPETNTNRNTDLQNLVRNFATKRPTRDSNFLIGGVVVESTFEWNCTH